MLTSKQRAKLRAMANGLETIGQIGKDGVGDNLEKLVGDALEARQLVKYRVLDTSPETPREAAERIAAATNSEVVQVIGNRFVLYHADKENPLV